MDQTENFLIVTSSPHIKSNVTTQRIMLDVIIALCPALAASVWIFGPRALLVTAVSVLCCVFFEWGSQKLFRRESTVGDLSAVVTGILIAFNMPPSVPLWMLPIGAAFAIVFTKQLFGGIGQNFANPAIVARIVLFLSVASSMSTFTAPGAWRGAADAVSTATPLNEAAALPSLTDMFFGMRAGCLGETCACALLLGGIYLVIRRVISPLVPLCYIGSTVLLCWLFGADPLYSLLSGGLLLGAIFMATDYATTPSTTAGKIVFALGCGLITAVIRCFGSYAEGVSFAILLMNILTPLIDRLIRQKPFGA